MKYALVQQWQQKAIPVQQACRVLGVSRAGFYQQKQRCLRTTDPVVSAQLQAAFTDSGRSYGSRRLCQALKQKGLNLGRYRVRTLMKKHGLHATWRRKFVHTTDSRHNYPVAENVLDRCFTVDKPNQAWVSDLTYIRTGQGWLYLAAIMDLYSRKIVGWSMAPSMPTDLVAGALHMALQQRRPGPGLILHSDRGSQYASSAYQTLLHQHEIRCSMSRKGNCWDNAVMERFFLNLKMERVWQRTYANHAEARKDITQYIVGFYNTTRLHSTLGYRSPAAYEMQTLSLRPIEVSEIT